MAPADDAFPFDKLGGFFERSPISLSICDATGPDIPLLMVNPAFEALSGYARDEMIGRNCRLLQPPGGAGPVRARIRAFLADDAVAEERFVVCNLAKDGRAFVNLLYLTRLRDRGGRRYFLGSQFDISRSASAAADVYDQALAADLDVLRAVGGELGLFVLGSFRSLATSASVIANTRLNYA